MVVKNAFDLQPAVDVTSDAVNSYVNLCLVPEDFLWKRTRVVENDSDPVFEETFRIRDVLYHKLREYTLCLFVMDTHPVLCLLYTSPSPRDQRGSRMPSSA